MKYYISLTDTNSRQYNFEIPEDGLEITCRDSFTVVQGDPHYKQILELMGSSQVFKIQNSVFNSEHLVTIQYVELPDGAF